MNRILVLILLHDQQIRLGALVSCPLAWSRSNTGRQGQGTRPCRCPCAKRSPASHLSRCLFAAPEKSALEPGNLQHTAHSKVPKTKSDGNMLG